MALPVNTIYLDKRRKKKDQRYPVKLRIYFDYETRFYHTGINASEIEFNSSYLTKNPKGEYNKSLKAKIIGVEAKANQVIGGLTTFTFESFEYKMFRPIGAGNDVFFHYRQIIEKLKKEQRFGTASNYELSMKSIKSYLSGKQKTVDQLHFQKVSAEFLNGYERWMIEKGNSSTTVGIYLRPLRAVFNQAIDIGDIDRDLYPFGKRKYQLPASQKVKKALDKESLQNLYEFDASGNPHWQKARDFWFFSYVCNGMNIKDIAELKFRNLNGDTLFFIRSKTKLTSKSNQKPVIVALNTFAKRVIQTYGNDNSSEDDYIFPILDQGISESEKLRLVHAFTRFINQHIKALAKHIGIDQNISTYWARHSFTTISIQNGASLEFIQDCLGHNSIATTMNYWKGFDVDAKRLNSDRLLSFSTDVPISS